MYTQQRIITHKTKEQAPGVFASWKWNDAHTLTYSQFKSKIIGLYGDDITEGGLEDNPDIANRAQLKTKWESVTDPAAKALLKILLKDMMDD